jgi:uncharacterized delta-60 repeat protein
VRYLTNGSLDPTFGNGGKVTTPVGVSDDRGSSLAIQNDGKIVLVGGSTENSSTTNLDFAAVRYNTDGSLDTGFGNLGISVVPVGVGGDYAAGVVIQPNGKIVIAGQVYGSPTTDYGLIRLKPDGSLDTTFGNNGKMITPVGMYDDYCNAVALQADGKIVAAGSSTNGPDASLPTAVFSMVRYDGDTTSSSPTVSGVITYGNAIGAPTPRFVSNVLVTGSGSTGVSTTTAPPGPNAGQYTLSGFASGSYTVTPTKAGGVGASISSFDAARIAQHVAGINVLTGNQFLVADVSGNGTLSSFDAGQVARYVAGISGFGATASWIFNPAHRAYASISGNILGEDYTALLMGEVSGNWTNTGARPISSVQNQVGRGPEKRIIVDLPKIESAVGKEMIIPITVQGIAGKDVISYEFDLRYDPSIIKPQPDPIKLNDSVSRGLSVVTNATEPGLLRVVVYGPIPITADGVLLNLRFTAVGKPDSVTPVTLERIMFNEGEPGITATGGEIKLSRAS